MSLHQNFKSHSNSKVKSTQKYGDLSTQSGKNSTLKSLHRVLEEKNRCVLFFAIFFEKFVEAPGAFEK